MSRFQQSVSELAVGMVRAVMEHPALCLHSTYTRGGGRGGVGWGRGEGGCLGGVGGRGGEATKSDRQTERKTSGGWG